MQTHLRLAVATAVLSALAGCAGANPGGPNRAASGVSPVVVFSPPPGMVWFTAPPALANASAGSLSTKETAQINAVQAAPGGRQLTVQFVSGYCDLGAGADAAETSDEIDVHVFLTSVDAMCPAVGYERTITIELNSPVAGRRIVYGLEGQVPASYPPGVAPSTSPPARVP